MLGDDKVRLRAPKDLDLSALEDLRNDLPTQQALLALPRPNSAARVKDWVSRLGDAPDAVFFVIEADGRTVGFVQLRAMDFIHGTGELGIALLALARHKGIGLRAIKLVEDYAFDVFGIRKVVLKVLASNSPAIRLYEKAGYRTVGVLREHFRFNGQHQDVVIMEHLKAGNP